MPDLRRDCIEAGARAWMEFEGDDWDAMGLGPQKALSEVTEHIFDAILSVLSERADEWDDAAAGIAEVDVRPGIVGPTDYLAVLRGDE